MSPANCGAEAKSSPRPVARFMAKIEQIQIKFVAVEDRLLLRVSSSDAQEFQFWMTRRFVKLIWPALVDSLKRSSRIHTQTSPAVKQELLEFEHSKAVNDSDFKTPYREKQRSNPLGTEPLLLSKMQIRRSEDGSMVLAISPQQGAGIDLAVNDGLLHSLVELIGNGARIADWELPALIDSGSNVVVPQNVTVN